MPPADPTEHAAADLTYLADSWGDLQVMRLAGTPLPWAARRLTAEQQQQMAERDRAERADRNPEAPGVTPTPLRPDVLDTIVDVETALADLEQRILDELGSQRNAAPKRELRDRVRWLLAARPMVAAHKPLTDRYSSEARRLATAVRYALRDVPDRLPLTGARCIACGLEQLTLHHGNDPHHDAKVTCDNPRCEPSTAQCGSRWRGRPCWLAGELDWLARQITGDVA